MGLTAPFAQYVITATRPDGGRIRLTADVYSDMRYRVIYLQATCVDVQVMHGDTRIL